MRKLMYMVMLVGLLAIGSTALAEEIGWYIPKPHIKEGDQVVYRPDKEHMKYTEKWGKLIEQLPGEKVIDFSGIKVKHIKGKFIPKPFKCERYVEDCSSDSRRDKRNTIEAYGYFRDGHYYFLWFDDGILDYYDKRKLWD